MNQHIIVKRDLLGTTIQPLTFSQALRKRKKQIPVLNLTDGQLQKLVQQEEQQGRKVTILPSISRRTRLDYPTEEELNEIRQQEEIEEMADIPPTKEEMEQIENRPPRKTIDIF